MKSKFGTQGLLVIGTESGCGKTVVTTGLAACLAQEGFKIRAAKPLHLGNADSNQSELVFLSTIAHSPLTYQRYSLAESGLLNNQNWEQLLSFFHNASEALVVELPGGSATELGSANGQDTAGLAAELGWPCLLVGKVDSNCLEKMVLNCHYLQSRQVNVLGQVMVFNNAEAELPAHHRWANANLDLVLAQRCGVPYLGSVAYSPSINVGLVSQGNLIKNISASLDLLPLIKSLNLPVCI